MSYNLPKPDRIEALLAGLKTAVDELDAGVPALDRSKAKTFSIYDLLKRANDDEPGYPPSSGHSGGSRSTGTHPNPVMQLATVGEPGSPQNDFEAILANLEGAKMRVDNAVRQLRDSRPRPQVVPKGPAGCRSCRRLPNNWVPLYEKREKDGLCRKCWEWWVASAAELEDRSLPPLGVIQAWRDGKKLTTRIVAEALAAEAEEAEAKPKPKSTKKGARRGVKRFARR